MARPKEFERDDALRAGVEVFWRKGFAPTTTEDLTRAMGIGRQSFYDTFGDKRQCFLDALRAYSRHEIGEQVALLCRTSPPLAALRLLLQSAITCTPERKGAGCLAMNAAVEFGATDEEVGAILQADAAILQDAVIRRLADAKTDGSLPDTLDVEQAARMVLCTRMGLVLGAKTGQPAAQLQQTIDFTLEQLTRR
ncbi:MAG TPA: TetR/AcrR family transcriptional regulator [Gemmatimonas aurantiaca]|uniref:TetR family transcriptional regulator n=2 Tax=Gemmatimonas aurantiaca TaxID=173480 RepID=C1ADK7_GEMAT|nr:TetR/AcrR family transcriptional regulator [Gemmatimonas aurantiaca]BAH40584.1 TetR family transcriptional regulator [Gemmatimonas aurantiaca T-27]HCT56391.1 TetR/AcrR family transcriptional regulator [Gemmatimonas aurantiaca]